MAVKVASGLSKVASRFLETAVEAGDMTKDSIVEGLIRTFKVGEKEARDAVEAKLGKPAAEAAPAPAPKAPSKVTKMKEQGPPPPTPVAATPPTEKPVPPPAARTVDESQFVSTTLPAKSMRPVADAYRQKYNMSEPSALVMNALENQILKDPDAIKAFQQYPGNTTKILEAIEDRIDVKQMRRDVNQPPRATRQEKFEKPEPFTPPTIISKAAVPDYESPVGPRPGVLASSAGTPPVREPAAAPRGLSTDARIAALRRSGMPLSAAESLLAQDLGPEAAKSAVTSFKARADKTSPDFSEMGYTPDLRSGGTLTAEEAAQLEAKGGFSKTATEGADYEGGLAGLGQRPEAEVQGLGGQYEAPSRPVTETGVVPSGTIQSSAERYLADRQARQAAKEQFANRPVPPPPSGLSTGQKAAIGAAGTAAVLGGAAAISGQLVDDRIEPTEEELRSVRPFTPKARELEAKYEALNARVESEIANAKAAREQSGLSPLTGEDETAIRRRILEEARPQAAAAKPSIPEGTGQTLAAKIAKTPAQVPVGGEGTKPSEKKPTTAAAGKQEKKPADATTSAMGSVAAVLNKEQASKKPNASEQTKQTTLDQLDAVVDQVNADERFKYQPVRTDLVQLRAEAYKAYKEKANRNEWMDLAEKAINAIGQFASAKAAYGTQFTGGLPLSRTDYGARTDQAFREYQAELGIIGEQAKAEERGAERLETAKDKEIARRQRTILERLEDERLQKKLAAGEKEARIRYGAVEDRSTSSRNREILKLELGDIDAGIKAKEAEAKTLANALKLGQEVGTGKESQFEKQLADFASAKGTTADVWKDRADKESGTFTSDKTYLKETILPQQVKDVEQSLNRLRQDIDLLRKQKQQKVQSYIGGEPAAAPAAVPPTGQAAPSSGKVVSKAQLDAYAAQYKMTPDAAAEYLKSQGYTVGR